MDYEIKPFEKKDENIAGLNALLAHAQTLETVAARKLLVSSRRKIQAYGKKLREDALAHNDLVLTLEKELVAIIEPEEIRLKALEEADAAEIVRKQREAKLPSRMSAVEEITTTIPDEMLIGFLMGMDDEEFKEYLNALKVVEAQRIEDEKAAQEAEAARKAAEENRISEARTTARIQELKRFGMHDTGSYYELFDVTVGYEEVCDLSDDMWSAQVSRVIEVAKVVAERQAKEKADADTAAAQERLKKQENFRKWLAENGYTEETKTDFKIVDNGTEVILYKVVGAFVK